MSDNVSDNVSTIIVDRQDIIRCMQEAPEYYEKYIALLTAQMGVEFSGMCNSIAYTHGIAKFTIRYQTKSGVHKAWCAYVTPDNIKNCRSAEGIRDACQREIGKQAQVFAKALAEKGEARPMKEGPFKNGLAINWNQKELREFWASNLIRDWSIGK